jgi:hypothetical protein
MHASAAKIWLRFMRHLLLRSGSLHKKTPRERPGPTQGHFHHKAFAPNLITRATNGRNLNPPLGYFRFKELYGLQVRILLGSPSI